MFVFVDGLRGDGFVEDFVKYGCGKSIEGSSQ